MPIMRTLLLTLLALFATPFTCLAASPVSLTVAQMDKKPMAPPSKAEVEAMVTQLRAAWKAKDAGLKVTAITAAKDVVHPKVIKEVARGLKDKEAAVRSAAIDALRWTAHPDSLKALTAVWKKDKDLRKDVELAAPFLKAIGQHGALSSLKLLTDKPLENTAQKALQARILSIGNIRSVKAIEALIDMMAKGGNAGRRGGRARGGRNRNDYRVALTVLTGVDLGADMDSWKKWWDKNQKGYKVKPKMPALPRDVERNWNLFWGIVEESARGTEREDRGDGPEGQ